MRYYPIFFFFLLSLSANENPAQLYLKNACNACHGMYGEGIGASPRLQGQKEGILLKKLKELKKGKTRTAFGNIMISFAKGLNEDQTIAMAKYLSTLKRTEQKEIYELEYDDNAGDGSS